MDVYLLDTNHIVAMLRAKDPRRRTVLAKMAALPPESHVCIATVTLAELEVGCAAKTIRRDEAQTEIRDVIGVNKLDVRPFTRHTAAEYGAIKAALMRQYDRAGRSNAAKWPEGWDKPPGGAKLGADEIDIMLVSHAVERNMVLVTGDRLSRIADALYNAGISLQRDNWLAP